MIAHLHKSPISSYAAPAVCLKSEISTDAPGYNPPVNANSPSCSLFFFQRRRKRKKKGEGESKCSRQRCKGKKYEEENTHMMQKQQKKRRARSYCCLQKQMQKQMQMQMQMQGSSRTWVDGERTVDGGRGREGRQIDGRRLRFAEETQRDIYQQIYSGIVTIARKHRS